MAWSEVNQASSCRKAKRALEKLTVGSEGVESAQARGSVVVAMSKLLGDMGP